MQIIDESAFKSTFKGKETALFTLKNNNGLVVQITNFGAKIVSIYAPDRKGNFADVVLGYDSIEGYYKGHDYFGAICGRCANRIANGQFELDGKKYQLPINNGPNSLHGGPEGFSNQVFDTNGVQKGPKGEFVKMSYISPDGEMGYPGEVAFSVTYTLTAANELILDYEATTNKTTIVNIASHSYFNLAGEGSGSIEGHELLINAKQFTPMNDVSIPLGELRDVKGTPMDFTTMKVIGRDINADDDQLRFGKGYDHNWVLDKPLGEIGLAADYYEKESGRGMKVYTSQPGVQLYTGNWTEEKGTGKAGHTYIERSALCLETQNFPDSINNPQFPSVILIPGETYRHSCIHTFYTK